MESEGLNLPLIRRRPLYKALNRTLHILYEAGLMKPPLEAEPLIAAARRRARSDDFGDETFREPLRRLLVQTLQTDRFQIDRHLRVMTTRWHGLLIQDQE